jgi:hypothetical protein
MFSFPPALAAESLVRALRVFRPWAAGLTKTAAVRHAPKSRLEREHATVRGGDTQAAADVAAEPEDGASGGEECAFAARASAASVCVRVRVERAAPERVRALECEHCLPVAGKVR